MHKTREDAVKENKRDRTLKAMKQIPFLVNYINSVIFYMQQLLYSKIINSGGK